jgi:sorting nexin-1/2
VSGEDQEGAFTVTRRFKEFNAFKNILKERWPGVYIPAIPEKKAFGNKEDGFIEERRSLLERFMKEVAKYDYLVNSQELKIFARDHGDVEKILSALPKQTPLMILEKYRVNFSVNEERDPEEVSKMKESIREFHGFVKTALTDMEKQKVQIKGMIKAADERQKITKEIIDSLIAFEDGNVDYYSNQNADKKLVNNPSNGDVKEKMEQTIASIRNPFKDTYIWLKGELLDLNGLNDSLIGRDAVIKAQGNLEQKKINMMKDLDGKKAGKKSLGGMFKSSENKAKDMTNLETEIKSSEAEIEDYKSLVSFLTLYMHDSAIKNFKKTKQQAYMQMMNGFCVKEISNSHTNATFWHQILENSGQIKA